MKDNSRKLTVKDFATIGIFCALMIVVYLAFSLATGASMFFNCIFNSVFAALILAPFYMYMSLKVGKSGVALIYNGIFGVMAALFQEPYMIPWFFGGGILAELVMVGRDGYKNTRNISVAWIISSLTRALHGMVTIWFFKDAYLKTGVSLERFNLQTKYYSETKWIVLSLVLTVIAAVVGSYIGHRLTKKHFKKSGVII